MTKGMNILTIGRPHNGIIGALSVWVAILITGKIPEFLTFLLTGLTAFFITFGANTINDIFDMEIDRINRPDRPIPSGKVSVRKAWIIGIATSLLGILPNFFLSPTNLVIACTALLLVILYTPLFKKRFLLGNMVVAIVTALAFPYGAATVGEWEKGLYPALIAFLIHLIRELVKDAEDREGDLANQARTVAIVLPVSIFHKTVSLLIMLSILVILYGYYGDFFGIYYLYVVLIFVIPLYINLIYKIWITKNYNKRIYSMASRWLKWSMVIGVVAIYLGRIS